MNLMKLTKLLATLGLGTLLAFSFSTTASAFTTADGSATVTWPGYDLNFVDGTAGVPNIEPVVVQIDLVSPASDTTLTDIYTQFPGQPNPSYWTGQKNVNLTSEGECRYPDTNTLIGTITTTPALDYTAWKCYFFVNSPTDFGFGIYRDGESILAISSATFTLAPRSIVQVTKDSAVSLVQISQQPDINNPFSSRLTKFENFAMLTPAIEPEPTPPPNPGPQPSDELAKTGGPTDALLWASSVSGAAVAVGVAMTLTRRRRQTQP